MGMLTAPFSAMEKAAGFKGPARMMDEQMNQQNKQNQNPGQPGAQTPGAPAQQIPQTPGSTPAVGMQPMTPPQSVSPTGVAGTGGLNLPGMPQMGGMTAGV